MERYHIYKLGIAILFYAVYCRRPMVVNGLEVDDVIGTNNKAKQVKSSDDNYVYYQGVQGRPGVDFPIYSRIPRNKFNCREVESGYYADLETDCQVFHICNDGAKVSFLCPNGTIFQQSDLICDWWFKVNCTNSPNLYEESAEQLRVDSIKRKSSRRVINRGDGIFSSEENSKEYSKNKPFNRISNRGNNATSTTHNSNIIQTNKQNVNTQSINENAQSRNNHVNRKNDQTGNNFQNTNQQNYEKNYNAADGNNNNNGQNSQNDNYQHQNSQNYQDNNRQNTQNDRYGGQKNNDFQSNNRQHNQNNNNNNFQNNNRQNSNNNQYKSDRGQANNYQENKDHKQFADRKMDVSSASRENVNSRDRGGRKYNSNKYEKIQAPKAYKNNVVGFREPSNSEESQIPQETASFVTNKYNNIQNTNKNPYPNHRQTYSDIKDPKTYYTNAPTSTSSVSPQAYAATNNNALNNGQPFVVSTPQLGVYTTQKPFKYSPTVPTTTVRSARLFKTTPTKFYQSTTASPTTYSQVETTFGSRTNARSGKQSNSYNNLQSTVKYQNNNNTPLPRAYSNLPIETFTHPPTVNNGKSTTVRKSKSKSSYTIGLNTVQGSVSLNTSQTIPVTYGSKATTTTKPKTTTKKANNIKLNLSSGSGFKSVKTSAKGRSYESNSDSNVIRLRLSNGEEKSIRPTLDNQIPTQFATKPPAIGFFVTKDSTYGPSQFITSEFNSGSITGSKNTYIPTTGSPVYSTTPSTNVYTEYHSNTYGFVKPTGIPKPKPFALPPHLTTIQPYTYSTDNYYNSDLPDFLQNPTLLPNYEISSASPFTNVPPTLPSSYQTYTTERFEYTTANPTYPTTFTTPEPYTTRQPSVNENVHNMIDTLREIANVRVAKEEDFENARPGLIVPPSVGPQTLHTLAVYFANALDGLVTEANMTLPQLDSELLQTQANENRAVNSLLSRETINKYNMLFKESSTEEPDITDDNDLESQHSNNAVQSPRVRQLAKVFTQALSSYLDNPDTFRKVLQEIRPTEPPPLSTLPTENTNEEDELLNFSDADIKPENPRLPTPPPANPTWGYILAFNNASTFKGGNSIDNNLGSEIENLQSADSQSFISQFNEISSNRVNKALKKDNQETTTIGLAKEDYTNKIALSNHWTSSPDATKLWETTLYVNPLAINQRLDTTDIPDTSTSKEVEGEDDFGFESSTKTIADESFDNASPDVSEYATESLIDYELRALPQFNLNSTQVHGILIDFMNATKSEESNKLQRILQKLNTTENDFLEKMKEIEKNPLTRRLILLLISECGTNASFETRASAVNDIINLAKPKRNNDAFELSSSNVEPVSFASHPPKFNTPNSFTKLVDPNLKEDDQDSRALQLLNSLYSIAAKYGKK